MTAYIRVTITQILKHGKGVNHAATSSVRVVCGLHTFKIAALLKLNFRPKGGEIFTSLEKCRVF
jgi:hypothetical protein